MPQTFSSFPFWLIFPPRNNAKLSDTFRNSFVISQKQGTCSLEYRNPLESNVVFYVLNYLSSYKLLLSRYGRIFSFPALSHPKICFKTKTLPVFFKNMPLRKMENSLRLQFLNKNICHIHAFPNKNQFGNASKSFSCGFENSFKSPA